ncbi:MAG: winged helix-turn-helix transcriptional regulator [Desulfobacteraceae bacterium]|nr:winged helix-turn-helix transcriptional regulator [Desulfobacteraceae bacterium]MBC2748985.1 winged helix-turn-helix transcriptional regulator [Desulfobacteraceae bacterium]
MESLFTGLISSKTRIKLLVRLFMNPGTQSYLRQLSGEFGLSTNAVREELNQLSATQIITSSKNGKRVFYRANESHPLFPELKSMVAKVLGIDQVIDGIVKRLGDLQEAYLLDDYAEGKDTGIIDLMLVGNIDAYHLNDLSRKTERYVHRKIRTIVFSPEEYNRFSKKIKAKPHLLIWRK